VYRSRRTRQPLTTRANDTSVCRAQSEWLRAAPAASARWSQDRSRRQTMHTRVHVGFVFSQPCGDKGNSKAHSLVDAAITAVSDKHVDLREHPFERQIAGQARISRSCLGTCPLLTQERKTYALRAFLCLTRCSLSRSSQGTAALGSNSDDFLRLKALLLSIFSAKF
jgi:hypothetical protein